MNLVATHHNYTSPLDYISHHALHTHIPAHHYTNYTAVTIHSLVLIVSPHLHLILTLTYKQHTYTHPLRSLVFPWLTFPSGFPLCVYLCTTWTVDSLSWSFAACLTDPACLLVILSVCCLPWPIALPLITNLSYLRCPRYQFDICLSDHLFVSLKLQVDLLSPLTSRSLHALPGQSDDGRSRTGHWPFLDLIWFRYTSHTIQLRFWFYLTLINWDIILVRHIFINFVNYTGNYIQLNIQLNIKCVN